MTTFLIFLAGLAAGAMNAAAGGGSFVSVPALIWAGVPSITANMSSTIALYPGSLASAWAFRENLQSMHNVSLKLLGCTTLVGGLCGAFLLLRTSNSLFDKVIPWLLLLGSLAFAFGRIIGRRLRRQYKPHAATLLFAQFLLGIYGGYFGGAVGIMMMAVWSVFGLHDLKIMNPVKVVLVAAANTVAVICFAVAGSVDWRATGIMLISAVLGGYFGALLAMRVRSEHLRIAVSCLNFIVTAAFFIFKYTKLVG